MRNYQKKSFSRGGFAKPKTANRIKKYQTATEKNRMEKKPKPNGKNRTEPLLFGCSWDFCPQKPN